MAGAKQRAVRLHFYQLCQLIKVSLASVMLFSGGLQPVPAHALTKTTDPPDQTVDCLGNLQGTISTKDPSVDLWQTSSLSWNVTVPHGCTGVKLYVDALDVSPTGSRSMQPVVDTVYGLQAVFRNGRRDLGLAVIKVKLLEEVTISANYMVPLLVQALKGDPVKRVVVANSVELDLTGYEDIAIGAGV